MCRFLGILAVLVVALSVYPLVAEELWYESPTLSIMTGFIYEPLKPYSIHEWKQGLGNEFDAERWAKDFKEAGAQHLKRMVPKALARWVPEAATSSAPARR